MARLEDISTISKGVDNRRDSFALIDGLPAVVLGAYVRDDYRIDAWTADLEQALATFRASLPFEIQLRTIYNQNDFVQRRLSRLLQNLLLGTLAVVLVVFLLMGWRSTLIVGAALPLSTLMVLFGLRILGVPIHQMSVTGLIIALGLLD